MKKVFFVLLFSIVAKPSYSQAIDTSYILLQETDQFFIKKSSSRSHPERIDFLFDKKPDKLIRSLFYHNKDSMEQARIVTKNEFDSYTFDCPCELYWHASKNPYNYVLYVIEDTENGEIWKYQVKVEFPAPPPPVPPANPNVTIDKIKKPPPLSEVEPQSSPTHCE